MRFRVYTPRGAIQGIIQGSIIGVTRRDTRSLEYSLDSHYM